MGRPIPAPLSTQIMHSKGHLILLLALWLQPGHLLAQWPDSNRLYAWHNAGFVQQEIRCHQVLCLPNRQPNQASALQQLIDTTPKPLMVLLGAGTYYMQQPITLPDSVVLKGMGNTQTQWVFDGGGKALAALIVQGQLLAGNRLFTQPALRGDTVLYLSNTSQIAAGSLLRLIQQDADLVNDSWAEGRTGQVVQVDSVSGNTVYLHQPLRMHYPLNRQPYARLLQPRRQVGIECLRVERTDNAPDSMGAANLYFSYATQCWVSGVESFKCNRAHIEVNYSAHLQISHNYLHDAFSFGSGGRAYGVALQMATSDVRVENNVFRKLRHAMLLQAGANGNVLAYNYAYESRKAGLLGIITTGEDLVCHGNYPYANLLEANYVQFASIDNAHGKNGPHNTFFRNAVYTTGFRITNPQSDSQTLVGNHRL
ncbi:MAG TPA: right-handed parallel beta-helix repeat-containing protein, partial [Phnomibacter sp.]|nr:right-handed parallel beta-helix repeat-containing protein [Phnomibacter sp.]